MRTLCKKALALCVVFALALTCFVGTLSVSAADPYDATLTVADVNVKFGDTTATAVLHIAVAAPGINEAIINIDSTIGTIDAEPVLDETTLVVDGGGDAYVDAVGDDFSKLFLSAREAETATDLNGILSADIAVVFTLNEGVKPGTYPINIVTEGVKAADKNETVVNLVYATAGNFVVACDHANATEDVTTAPTCTEPGVKTITCACGYTTTEAIPETGHAEELTYTSNEDGTHAVDCPNCEDVFEAEDCVDNDADNACDKCSYDMTPAEPECEHVWEVTEATAAVMGGSKGSISFKCSKCDEEMKDQEVVYEDAVSVYGMEAFVESEILIKYNADIETYFPAGYDADSIILSVETNNTKTGESEVEYVYADESYVVGTKTYWEAGVAAYQMTENMRVTVYCKVNDVWCSGWQADVTFTSYAKTLLKSTKTSPAVKTVIVDLLNFGTAVQTLNNYNVENLANAEFDSYQSLGSDTSVSPEATNDVDFKIDYTADIYHLSYQLVADSRVETQIKLQIPQAYVDKAVYVGNYTDKDGNAHNIAYVVNEEALSTLNDVEFDEVYIMTSAGTDTYFANFAEFAAYEAETFITFTLYNNGAAGETLGFSVKGATAYTRQTFASSAKHAVVFDALIRYLDSSKVAFGK